MSWRSARIEGGSLLGVAARGLPLIALALEARVRPSADLPTGRPHVVVRDLSAAGEARPAGLLELLVDGRSATAAALVLVSDGEAAAPIWFDAAQGQPPRLRTLVDPRALFAARGRSAGYVLLGDREGVASALAAASALRLREASERGSLARVLVETVNLDTKVGEAFQADTIERARALLDAGHPSRAVDLSSSARARRPPRKNGLSSTRAHPRQRSRRGGGTSPKRLQSVVSRRRYLARSAKRRGCCGL